MGLDALEHWLEVIPRQTTDPHLKEILPPLNDYLSKEWLEQRERAILEGLSYEAGSSRKKNRSEAIEKIKRREEDKVWPFPSLFKKKILKNYFSRNL